MKNLITLVLLIGISSAVFAQSGAIRGRITDKNNIPLPGATIMIEDLNRGTVSDDKGFYEFLKIPEGNYNLVVSFIGYGTENLNIEVPANNTVKAGISLGEKAMIGEEVLVLGDRLRGQARALNNQRSNSNITNIVASDQIGRFPDANIGDALKRVPGITMQNDQGEARDIIIRGMAPQLNSVTLNGERIPSAEGDNRRIQMDLIPSDMIETIEVNKAVLPDMDADAIGGSVNLVTRSYPTGQRISATAASGFNFLSNKPIWTGALILGDRFADDKLGVMVSGSYNNHNFGSDNVEAVWVDDEVYGPVLEEYDLRTYVVQRIRRSASLGLDYQFNNNHGIYLTAMYNHRDDWENRYRFRVGNLDESAEAGDITEIEPGVYNTFGRIERQTKGGINSDRVRSSRLEDQRVTNVTLRGEHLFGNQIKMDWSGTYARASESRPNERYISYRTSDLPVNVDISDPYFPIVTPSVENQFQTLELNEIIEENGLTWEEDLNARLNFKAPVSDLGIIKFGGAFRSKVKKRDNDFFEYIPTGGVNPGDAHPLFGGSWDDVEGEYTDMLMQTVPVVDQTKDNYLAGEQYNAGNYVDKEFLGNLDLTNPNLEQELVFDEFIDGNYTASEDIYAAYAMADLQFSKKFSAVVGARLENTRIEYTGFSYDADTDQVTNTTGENSYTNFFPGVHLKYDFRPNTILRVAYTNTLARPNYFSLVPYQLYEPDGPELEAGNPNLRPAVSTNFDLMAENYFESIGLVSAGAFFKSIDDFIYEIQLNSENIPPFGEVDYTTFDNGGTATVLGAEVAFQRQLDFLPGLGLYLNYTYTNSSTTGIEGREGVGLPGAAPHMFNTSLSYENENLILRASLNYSSDYIDELGGDAFEDRYYDEQLFIDLNGSYLLTPKLRAFFEVNNLTNQPLRYYQGIKERTMQMEYYSVRMNLGVKFDLNK